MMRAYPLAIIGNPPFSRHRSCRCWKAARRALQRRSFLCFGRMTQNPFPSGSRGTVQSDISSPAWRPKKQLEGWPLRIHSPASPSASCSSTTWVRRLLRTEARSDPPGDEHLRLDRFARRLRPIADSTSPPGPQGCVCRARSSRLSGSHSVHGWSCPPCWSVGCCSQAASRPAPLVGSSNQRSAFNSAARWR